MKSEYIPTIGLEIHAELNTQTKMFCNSKNDPDEKRPNVNICPVCLAHPGTLPVINKEAVKSVLKIGLAVGGTLADFTEFDRKNYFYPDIPKGFQISQYKYPLISGGAINNIALERIHLEEDTARSSHTDGEHSLIDFNRAGVPLMELVTKPVITDAEEAVAFAKELQLLLQYLGASEANMEKGEMRVEANISVRKIKDEREKSDQSRTLRPPVGVRFEVGPTTGRREKAKDVELGTKVEVKNLNSFRIVGKAIQYETKRQIAVLEDGGEVVQETRGFNESTGETFSQRLKESSHDYRYFPEPDLPKLYINEIKEFSKENLKKEIPELPWQKRERLQKEYGIKLEDADMYVNDRELGEIFERRAKKIGGKKDAVKILSNLMTSFEVKLRGDQKEDYKMTDENFLEVLKMIDARELSSLAGKEVLSVSSTTGESPKKIAEEKNLIQKNDKDEINKIAEEIVAENKKIVEEIKGGKESGLQFLVGQGMKKTGGAMNPKLLTEALKNIISME